MSAATVSLHRLLPAAAHRQLWQRHGCADTLTFDAATCRTFMGLSKPFTPGVQAARRGVTAAATRRAGGCKISLARKSMSSLFRPHDQRTRRGSASWLIQAPAVRTSRSAVYRPQSVTTTMRPVDASSVLHNRRHIRTVRTVLPTPVEGSTLTSICDRHGSRRVLMPWTALACSAQARCRLTSRH